MALFIYPGAEAKGLFIGMIIGCWPFALMGELGIVATLLSVVLTAIEVALCAWLMDKCRLSKKYLAVAAIFILAGTVIAYGTYADGFDQWKHGELSVIVPEDYEITASDYRRLVLIPVTVDGGMFGLYLAVALGALLAAGKTLLKNRIKQSGPGCPPQGVGFPEP